MRIGVDSGGTFTDFAWQVGVLKLPSTPHDPAQAIVAGIKQILAANPQVDARDIEIVHGTTVATNTLLTRSGARVALVTTAGFEDVIEIGRQDRPELYDLHPTLPPPLVPRELRLGVKERIAADGSILTPLDSPEVERVARRLAKLKPDAVAVSLLHAYAHPLHEQLLAAGLRARLDAPVFFGSEVDPQPREYERTSTTVIHAYLAPKVQTYLRALQRQLPGRLQILTSSGGMATVDQAISRPADLVLSGPAGGVAGAAQFAALCGVRNFIGLDMGGTSTDVCLGWGGTVAEDNGRDVTGLPLRVPRLAVHTVGAGGGSIARVGAGGTLLVGPESAGADPGPAAYGKGDLPTVTDADIVLGRIKQGAFGGLQLDHERSRVAITRLGKQLGLSTLDCAAGIVRIADQRMAHAAAEVSQAQGYDPRQCALIPFGGAGPLHACGIAEQLGIRRILIPPAAGVLSAIGAAGAWARRDAGVSVMRRLDEWPAAQRDAQAHGLTAKVAGELPPRRQIRFLLQCRYLGQSFELPVSFLPEDSADVITTRFQRAHKRAYGYARENEPIEVVSLSASGRGGGLRELPLPAGGWAEFEAATGEGPCSWGESTFSIHVATGWQWRRVALGAASCLELTRPY